jgi:hypothetical protein
MIVVTIEARNGRLNEIPFTRYLFLLLQITKTVALFSSSPVGALIPECYESKAVIGRNTTKLGE